MMDIKTLIFVMVALLLGSFIASMLIGYLPDMFTSGWISGIVIGAIQILILSLFGLLAGKLGLWNILIGSILILVGGMIGGYITDMISMSGMIATVIVLAVQAVLLMTMGIVRGGKGKTSLKV